MVREGSLGTGPQSRPWMPSGNWKIWGAGSSTYRVPEVGASMVSLGTAAVYCAVTMCQVLSIVLLICSILVDLMSRVIMLSLPVTQDVGAPLGLFPFLRMKKLRVGEAK